jgi:hypothetical protein
MMPLTVGSPAYSRRIYEFFFVRGAVDKYDENVLIIND